MISVERIILLDLSQIVLKVRLLHKLCTISTIPSIIQTAYPVKACRQTGASLICLHSTHSLSINLTASEHIFTKLDLETFTCIFK